MPVIAHAGGQWNNRSYTNSLQALSSNYSQGVRWFEIDFLLTSDQHWICLHDWQDGFNQLLKELPSTSITPTQTPVTLAEFEQIIQHPAITAKPCTINTLKEWFMQHPDARLVTDTKESDALALLAKLKTAMPNALHRIYPQIYQPSDYEAAHTLGYQHIIWTLYRYKENCDAVLSQAKKHDFWAVTMSRDYAGTGLAIALHNLGISTYVHTVNEPLEAYNFKEYFGISNIYTDVLFDITVE